MLLELSYLTYLVITIAITIWVARTLSSNGLVWLIDAFDGNDALANSINHMLVVGFYLINLGYLSLALRFGSKPSDLAGAIEFLLGLLVGIAMDFHNLAWSQIRTDIADRLLGVTLDAHVIATPYSTCHCPCIQVG